MSARRRPGPPDTWLRSRCLLASLGAMSRIASAAREVQSYLICATPRTGSSLLCGLLQSTGVAGRPESYFRQPDERSWASQWGLARSDDTFDYADYIRGVLAAGRSE